MTFDKNTIIVIVGPTAVGKTGLSIRLAKHYNTEILSADSRQFYKETQIATAKPTLDEMDDVKHHFINSLSIAEEYNAGKFERESLALLDTLFSKSNPIIVVGGSGLYVRALCDGMDEMPEIPGGLRKQIIKEYEIKGIEYLQERITELDPEYFQYLDIQNPQRLIRAIEVCMASGLPYSFFRKQSKLNRPFEIIKIGLERPREELYDRINERMDRMIDSDLFEEAKSLYDQRHLNALQTLGYSEIFGFLDGKYNKEEAIRLLKRNSRRFAKRQMTWFNKDENVKWFHPREYNLILQSIELQK